MNSKTIIAVDPGRSGGFAVRTPDGKLILIPMPDTESGVSEILDELVTAARLDGHTIEAVVERVGGFVGKGQPGAAMFTFGRGVGLLIGLLLAMKVPLREVTPQAWQKAVGAGTSNGRSKTQWKRHLLDLARKRFPDAKGLTLATCDAALLLDSQEART